jgi:hypothetical protein
MPMLIPYGTTQHFAVFYDSTFTGGPGQVNGPALAQNVLDYCEYDLARLSMLFGNILPTSFPIAINLVPSGNNNNGSNNINSSCNVNTMPGMPPGTVVAELAEIFMVRQNKGWVFNGSNGEALSRVCAGILYPNNAWLFCSSQIWLDAGRPDWVDKFEPTDGDYVSFGCGILFLYYLANQLNYQWPDIIGAGAPTTNTLAETAQILGVTNAWSNFISLISTYLPPGAKLPLVPTAFGPQPTDNAFPLGPLPAQVPALYMRHNLADNGTSHTGSLSDSPDIILKNNPVANPQATFSTAGSVASDTESDPDVLTNQDNYVYTRVWNRGADAENVFATVYWAQPSTLVTPDTWNLIGTSYFPHVPGTSAVQVSSLGITWPADMLPGIGHDCFVATVGNAYAPAPSPTTFASFNDFVNYIYANNNITWRNFNIVAPPIHPIKFPHGLMPLPFFINGAWDRPRAFRLETQVDLPEGSRLALQVPEWVGRGLKPAHADVEEIDDAETDPKNRRRLRLNLNPRRSHRLGEIELPVKTRAASHMLVHIPAERHARAEKIAIRQLDGEREVGRITWLILPPR